MNFNYDNNELKIISNEVHIIENLLTNIFGLYAVQIGLPIDNFLQKSRIQNTYFFGENLISNPDLQTIKLDVIHSLDQFPLLSNSIDLVVLPHLLEIIPDNIKISNSTKEQVLKNLSNMIDKINELPDDSFPTEISW